MSSSEYPVTGVSCSVVLYPYESGGNKSYTLDVLAVNVMNTVSGPGGSFRVTLPPGGPNGMYSTPSWADLATPMSSVVITMSRGVLSQVVMIGVVESSSEQFDRSSVGSPPNITQQIMGRDIGYYFATSNFYVLSAQMSMAMTAVSPQSVYATAAGSESVLGGTTPAKAAQRWYEKVMAGSSGIQASALIPATADTFANSVSYWFQEFNGPINVPYTASFLADGSNWFDKFRQFCPFPWYECFAITSPKSFYASASTPSATLTIDGESYYPSFIVRRNPRPSLTYTNSTLGLDASDWNALPEFTHNLDAEGPLAFTRSKSLGSVCNFFLFQPTAMTAFFGNNNQNPYPLAYWGNTWTNVESIKRYGYRPVVSSVEWFADFTEMSGQQNYQNFSGFKSLVAQVSLRLVAQYNAASIMKEGMLATTLRPDIMPGCRFTGALLPGEEDWTFYIESVEHNFVFGQGASTVLNVSHGLPSAIYADNSDLLNVLRGRFTVTDGDILIDETVTGVELSSSATANEIMNIANTGKSQTNQG